MDRVAKGLRLGLLACAVVVSGLWVIVIAILIVIVVAASVCEVFGGVCAEV